MSQQSLNEFMPAGPGAFLASIFPCLFLTAVSSPSYSQLLWVLVPSTAVLPRTLKCHRAATEGHAVSAASWGEFFSLIHLVLRALTRHPGTLARSSLMWFAWLNGDKTSRTAPSYHLQPPADSHISRRSRSSSGGRCLVQPSSGP